MRAAVVRSQATSDAVTRKPSSPIDDLAARIRELETSGPGGPSRSRGRSAGEVGSQAELDAERAAAAGEGLGAAVPGEQARAGEEAPALPSRDVDDDRGPSLVSLVGQEAHDEALGVLPDGTQVLEPKPKRPKKAKAAQLAFSDAEPHQRAIELAYKLVSQRERTTRQVRDKLTAKDCSPAAIDAALEELGRYGFVDDARYAKLFAEDKRRLQGWGERRIRGQLVRDGISREILDGLFADGEAALSAPSELEAALELLRRKRPDLSDPKVKSRMAGMLARRGIASPVVFQALREHARSEDR